MKLKLDKTNYTIAKFQPDFPVPTWFQTEGSQFKSITYTDEECSIIMPTEHLDATEAQSIESDWFLLKIEGILDFSLTGILHKIATPLAEKEISIFAVSTYNTDYILMKQANLELAVTTLTTAGHQITT
ncbi:ACT domain-containing protein [Listeria grandensis]|uniref:ACT domain-containing protein n=1 Tax=Listeria grandensis TaxID=1494963 RepID=A0A7X0Y363_9LIST|nr:ACT domain-containing protein [Listeria grandensis]MBC1473934.1 ACT domain-containing protein [Listeria grandensis]MBC1936044.1 ACT domain-containing protein [Listeria grandensis]